MNERVKRIEEIKDDDCDHIYNDIRLQTFTLFHSAEINEKLPTKNIH